MDLPDFMDYLILDELVSEEKAEAERRQRDECGYDPDNREDNVPDSSRYDFDE